MGNRIGPAGALGMALLLGPAIAGAAADRCSRQSGPTTTPVLELYTSEGCSSCPPADQWLSAVRKLQPSPAGAVIQAFHVGYWDYIGWVDRFANPAHTQRQRQIAQWNGQRAVYTPQLVLNGRDWRDWHRSGVRLPDSREAAQASISLRQRGDDQFEATVSPHAGAPAVWTAYWTVTEHGHITRVQAGENAGETLQHDYVVRQYTPAGDYRSQAGAQKLQLRPVAATPGHARQVNLVVVDSRTGRTLQALSVDC